jgi:preprotein translocase subunit YajC
MLNNLLISDAVAQTTEAATTSQDFSFASFVPLILIFAVFYFLIVRPQSKKMKDHQLMVEGLKIGNKVITSSGIIGKIRDINKESGEVELEIAEGVSIKILKNYIGETLDSDKKSEKKAEKKSKKVQS